MNATNCYLFHLLTCIIAFMLKFTFCICLTWLNLLCWKLLKISPADLISKGNSYISARHSSAKGLLYKVLKLRLGRGLYGECLGVRADGNSDLSNEIGKELSLRSAAAGLRPIGAVIYMQRKNLKMCLRSMDPTTDTSEVAKAYGGGGSPSSSSFIIRMDEYNQWLPVHQPRSH